MKIQVCEAVNNIIEDKTGQSIATCWGNQRRRKTLAKELVRRWNAFEEGGLVEELRTACGKLLKVYDPYDVDERLVTERLAIQKFAEAALAKS